VSATFTTFAEDGNTGTTTKPSDTIEELQGKLDTLSVNLNTIVQSPAAPASGETQDPVEPSSSDNTNPDGNMRSGETQDPIEPTMSMTEAVTAASSAAVEASSAASVAANEATHASDAIDDANDAIDAIEGASDATEAQSLIDKAESAVNQAASEVNDVINAANDAIEAASEAVDAAEDAVGLAEEAVDEANDARVKADAAQNAYRDALQNTVDGNTLTYEERKTLADLEIKANTEWQKYLTLQNTADSELKKATDKIVEGYEAVEDAFVTAQGAQDEADKAYKAWESAESKLAAAIKGDRTDPTTLAGLEKLRDEARDLAQTSRAKAVATVIEAAKVIDSAIEATAYAKEAIGLANTAIGDFNEAGLSTKLTEAFNEANKDASDIESNDELPDDYKKHAMNVKDGGELMVKIPNLGKLVSSIVDAYMIINDGKGGLKEVELESKSDSNQNSSWDAPGTYGGTGRNIIVKITDGNGAFHYFILDALGNGNNTSKGNTFDQHTGGNNTLNFGDGIRISKGGLDGSFDWTELTALLEDELKSFEFNP
jgi:hypothetical protein